MAGWQRSELTVSVDSSVGTLDAIGDRPVNVDWIWDGRSDRREGGLF